MAVGGGGEVGEPTGVFVGIGRLFVGVLVGIGVIVGVSVAVSVSSGSGPREEAAADRLGLALRQQLNHLPICGTHSPG